MARRHAVNTAHERPAAATVLPVQFLTRERNEDTEPWWDAALSRDDVPLVVRELLQERRVMVTDAEAVETLVWARSVEGWDEDRPALAVATD